MNSGTQKTLVYIPHSWYISFLQFSLLGEVLPHRDYHSQNACLTMSNSFNYWGSFYHIENTTPKMLALQCQTISSTAKLLFPVFSCEWRISFEWVRVTKTNTTSSLSNFSILCFSILKWSGSILPHNLCKSELTLLAVFKYSSLSSDLKNVFSALQRFAFLAT